MIGKFARPKQIMFTPDLPKTRSGKIMRRLLRDIAEQRDLGDVTTLADSERGEHDPRPVREGRGVAPPFRRGRLRYWLSPIVSDTVVAPPLDVSGESVSAPDTPVLSSLPKTQPWVPWTSVVERTLRPSEPSLPS